METLKLLVTVFQDEEGWYVAECPAIPGCMSQGRTFGGTIDLTPTPGGCAATPSPLRDEEWRGQGEG